MAVHLVQQQPTKKKKLKNKNKIYNSIMTNDI